MWGSLTQPRAPSSTWPLRLLQNEFGPPAAFRDKIRPGGRRLSAAGHSKKDAAAAAAAFARDKRIIERRRSSAVDTGDAAAAATRAAAGKGSVVSPRPAAGSSPRKDGGSRKDIGRPTAVAPRRESLVSDAAAAAAAAATAAAAAKRRTRDAREEARKDAEAIKAASKSSAQLLPPEPRPAPAPVAKAASAKLKVAATTTATGGGGRIGGGATAERRPSLLSDNGTLRTDLGTAIAEAEGFTDDLILRLDQVRGGDGMHSRRSILHWHASTLHATLLARSAPLAAHGCAGCWRWRREPRRDDCLPQLGDRPRLAHLWRRGVWLARGNPRFCALLHWCGAARAAVVRAADPRPLYVGGHPPRHGVVAAAAAAPCTGRLCACSHTRPALSHHDGRLRSGRGPRRPLRRRRHGFVCRPRVPAVYSGAGLLL